MDGIGEMLEDAWDLSDNHFSAAAGQSVALGALPGVTVPYRQATPGGWMRSRLDEGRLRLSEP